MSKTLPVIMCGSRTAVLSKIGASRHLTSHISERRVAQPRVAAAKERASNSISDAVSNTRLREDARAAAAKPARALEFYGLRTTSATRTNVDSATTRP